MFELSKVNLFKDFEHTLIDYDNGEIRIGIEKGRRSFNVVNRQPELRIYQHFPGFRFCRLGTMEGACFQFLFKKEIVDVDDVHIFHCTIQSKKDLFLRGLKQKWRREGSNMSLSDYGDSKNVDVDEYYKKYFEPYVIDYEPEKYYPYPKLIKEVLAKPLD